MRKGTRMEGDRLCICFIVLSIYHVCWFKYTLFESDVQIDIKSDHCRFLSYVQYFSMSSMII